MNFGFIRAASLSPRLVVADCNTNAENIIKAAKEAEKGGAKIAVFPELSITGYTCGDLFFQKSLQKSAEAALSSIIKQTSDLDCLIFVGLPVAAGEGIYNCAAAIFKGQLLALIAKTFLPNYGEFYERRQFTPFQPDMETRFISFAGFDALPFGTDILICDQNNPEIKVACEICEDLWTPLPPSTRHALNGANVIVNLSAGNEIIGKADYRRNLVQNHSAKLIAAYVYSNAGKDESTQDMVFAGHKLICENGSILAQSQLFGEDEIIYADIDIERLCQERRRTTSFGFSVNHAPLAADYTTVEIALSGEEQGDVKKGSLKRFVDAHPFVPSDKANRTLRCEQVITLQAQGLAKRLRHINCQSAVIGLSGGLDSTLALLVTCRAFDLCGFDRKKITAITMPCFGTTDRTYKNACKLAEECGANLKEIPIADAVRQHFKDIGQEESLHDVTYENGQARTRTLILMNYANKTNGIVIGTGDLSELALGWCTYNGDHMSMYGVNSSVPKTLVRYLVEWFADQAEGDASNSKKSFASVLRDILDTPVSPELLPPTGGKISQVTEDLVGPYELHDFYLYYLLRFGFSPKKIFFLAKNAELPYDDATKVKWLRTFYRRFFSQQFKRSCMPDGAKVGTINLSPRGDWRMPSDASAAVWLKEIDLLEEEIKGGKEC
ncbi:NAD+ synthetase [Treponema sp. JC4]|uniref:NAD(+) synthase n=1 Tax=Treponema sp. JC4 TaxID=1124982 RepID=UPI00025B072C|nr:NAD(+) synthase [Treponema sp. JC4]EID85247.1 NAD+ synthetase [Treponema sp. JC4]